MAGGKGQRLRSSSLFSAEYRDALGEHGPHQDVSALGPSERVSEFGD